MAKTKVPGGYISDEAITSAHLHSSHGITTNDIGEHTNNKYYTDARVDARLAASKSANLFTTGNIEIGSDTGKLRLGTGADLRIYHNGADSYIDNFTGDLVIQQGVDDADIILKCDDGSGGTTAYLTLDGSNTNIAVAKTMVFADSSKASFGAAEDLRIYHDGFNSYIDDAGTGNLLIRGSEVVLGNAAKKGVRVIADGAVQIRHNDITKIETTSAGAAVTGNLSVSGNLEVTGTTTTVNTVTMNAQNAVIFEGATADAHETTLTIIDPTADRTINLPNQSGTIPVLAAASNTAITATPTELNYVDGVTSAIQTQIDSKQATISSTTDLTLSSVVATSSNESRFTALSIGADADIYLYESATNAFTIRTGASGAYKYFTLGASGQLDITGAGLATSGTERISSGGNLTNIGTIGSGAITSTGASSFGTISSGAITSTGTSTFGNIDLNGGLLMDIDQINGVGASGWLDFNMDTDSIYPVSTTDNQTVLGSVTHMNFVGDSNANGTGGIFNFGYGVNNADSGTFTKTMDLDRSGNLTVIGALTGASLDINGTGDVSGGLTVGNVEITSTGSIEIFRSNGAFIDFKDSSSDDFDSRIMGGNSLIFTVGGAGSTVTGLTLGSGSATFNGDIITTKAGGDLQFNGGSTGYVKSTTGLELDFDSDNNQSGMNFKITHNGGTELFKIINSGAITFNQAYTFPTSDGSANQVLRTDGSGNLSFATVSGGGGSGFSTITEPSAGQIKIGAQSGANEGGEVLLENAAANGGGSYTTDIHLDNFQNTFRVHAAGSVLFSSQTGTGNATVAGALAVSGDLTASGNLTVDDKLTIGDATANSNSYIEFGERITASETNKPFIGQTNSGNSTSQDLGIGVRSGSGVIKLFAGNTTAFNESSVRATIANTYINFTEPLQIGGSEFIDENKKITLSSAHTKQKIEVYGGGHEWIGTSANTLEFSGANINFNGGQGTGSPVLQHGGTNIMDTNKNLVNIGTIGTTGTVTTDVSGGSDNYYYYGKESGTIRYSVYENSNNVYINTWGGMYLRANQHGGSGGGLGASGAVFNAANGLSTGTYGSTNGGASNGKLQLYGSTANKQADLYCSNGNLHIDADDGNGIYLNWYGSQSATSTAGTYFGDANAGQVARIDGSGNFTLSGTVDGVDIAARNSVLTSTTTTANAALPKAGGAMSGTLNMANNNLQNARMTGTTTYLPGHAYSNTHDGSNVYWHIGSASGSTNKQLNLRIYNSSNTYVLNTWNTSGLSLYGNLTLSGTVDGRDVAADGTKLDGIAANANNYSFPYTISASASNSTVVQRHSSGYIFANYFNTTANDVSSGITKIACETSNDSYIRWGTAAAVRTFLNVADGANNYSLPASPSFTSPTATDFNANYFDVVAASGNGLRFWNGSNAYRIYMAAQGTSGASRMDSTSDYNMYFRMGGGTNRGFVFQNSTTNVLQADAAGNLIARGNLYVGTSSLANNHYNTTSTSRLTFGGGNDIENYHIGTSMENVGGNYTKLDLRWHTGIRMGAQQSYGGIRIFDSEDLGTLRFSINNGSADTVVHSGNFTVSAGEISNSDYNVGNMQNGALNIGRTDTNYAFAGGTWASDIRAGIMANCSETYEFVVHDSGDSVDSFFKYNGTDFEMGNNIGWGTTTFAFASSITAAGNITAYASDKRLKENIKPIDNALEKVMKIRGVEFDWTDEAEELGFEPKCKHETGVIAQEIEEVMPDAIAPAPFNKEYKTVEKDKIVALLIEAVKEQQKQIEELKKKLETK